MRRISACFGGLWGGACNRMVVAAVTALVAHGSAQAAITSHSCTVQPNNGLRFDCTVTLDASDGVRVGCRKDGEVMYNWSDYTGAGLSHSVTLYNFEPGFDYDYRVEVGGPGIPAFGDLGVATLPVGLAFLDLTVSGVGSTNYVLFDTDGCDEEKYVVVYDLDGGFVSWYQSIADETFGDDLTGFSYSPGRDTIYAIVDKAGVYEWDWGGAVLHSRDMRSDCSGSIGDVGPCPHHDVRKPSGGSTWVIASRLDTTTPLGDFSPRCNADQHLVDDGVLGLDGTWSVIDDDTLITDLGYDPSVDAGPDAVKVLCDSTYYEDVFNSDADFDGEIDWTHVNGFTAGRPGSQEGTAGSASASATDPASAGDVVSTNMASSTPITAPSPIQADPVNNSTDNHNGSWCTLRHTSRSTRADSVALSDRRISSKYSVRTSLSEATDRAHAPPVSLARSRRRSLGLVMTTRPLLSSTWRPDDSGIGDGRSPIRSP